MLSSLALLSKKIGSSYSFEMKILILKREFTKKGKFT